MRTCHCTNQCLACGQCCAVGCAHRGTATRYIPPGRTTTPYVQPLTEEDIRRIIREELGRQP